MFCLNFSITKLKKPCLMFNVLKRRIYAGKINYFFLNMANGPFYYRHTIYRFTIGYCIPIVKRSFKKMLLGGF